ncbi:MAG: TetR/AcrR family transcriptional regulator [Oscillospiraceae bacterium]|nr:TetR/AcrR family transcriptional regulator [Oscillospiraceae bacterium]
MKRDKMQSADVKDTKYALVDSLFELLRTHKLHEISINQIADGAHVHRNTFYYYFESKYDLAKYLVKYKYNRSFKPEDTFKEDAIYRFSKLIHNDFDIYSNLLASLSVDDCVDIFYQEIRKQILYLVNEKYFDCKIPQEERDYLIYWNSYLPSIGLAHSILTEVRGLSMENFLKKTPNLSVLPNLREATVKASIEYYKANT